jgi:hypothetical protein
MPTSEATLPRPSRSRRRTYASGTAGTLRFEGLDVIGPLLERAFADGNEWCLLPTMANGMPTAASYLKAPGDTIYRAFKFDVLRIVDGRIAEITTFGPMLFSQFGLPAKLEG